MSDPGSLRAPAFVENSSQSRLYFLPRSERVRPLASVNRAPGDGGGITDQRGRIQNKHAGLLSLHRAVAFFPDAICAANHTEAYSAKGYPCRGLPRR
ncbi:uncharacterized protein V6R79_012785 [Siganus canaliculatus]